MKKLFVDTSGWVAVVNRRDQYHEEAKNYYKHAFKKYGILLTTNLVAAETYILLRLDCGWSTASSWWEKINTSLKIKMIYADAGTMFDAFSLLQKYSDHPFSLTDAVSFITMRQSGIDEAFAFDNHFTVAGYQKLPVR
ncbi:MAG: PIN domain-containing protein [Bacillota bacterium]